MSPEVQEAIQQALAIKRGRPAQSGGGLGNTHLTYMGSGHHVTIPSSAEARHALRHGSRRINAAAHHGAKALKQTAADAVAAARAKLAAM